MPKRPRRSIVEYQKDVELARLRRKTKEKQNQMFISEHGVVNMSHQQDLLMGTAVTHAGCNYTDATYDVPRLDVMHAIVITACIVPVTETSLGWHDDATPLRVENLLV